MSDEKLIRLETLKSVMKARLLTIEDLSRDVGGRYTYWRDLLAGEKSFGEKIARKIEASLKPPLARGHLDGASLASPVPAEPLLPLQDGEPDLIAAFRLLSAEAKSNLLHTVGQLVLATHGPTLDLMRRLNVETRADDAVVIKALADADQKSPRRRAAAPKTAAKKRHA